MSVRSALCRSFGPALFSLFVSLPVFAGQEVFLRIRAVGDTMLGNAPTKQVPSFNYLNSILSETRNADVMFGNYEGTLCDRELTSWKCKPGQAMCFGFRGPTRLAKDLREAGFHVLNIANNHIYDYGNECAADTARALREEGMTVVGLKSSLGAPTSEIMSTYEFRGKKIAFIGIHYSRGWGGLISINDESVIRELVTTARKSHDLVVVSVHAGAEGVHTTRTPLGVEMHKGENRGDVRKFSRLVIDSGADLVIGHGPHVLRGLEIYKNKLIIHSLGNFATYTLFSFETPMQLGAIVEAGLSENGDFVAGKIIPTHQYYEPRPGGGRGQIRLEFDPQKRAISEMKRLSVLDFPSHPLISDDGFFTPKEQR